MNVEWIKTDAEVQSVEALAEHLMGASETEFTALQLQLLNFNTHRPVHTLRVELESYGFSIAKRPLERRVRGFTTSSNDRWTGPGSSPTSGGSGWEQINGFAGRQG
jgi:hypothetical protein